MNEKDMEYLGNIDTSPGPNAGRSIDPTKPGPGDAQRKTPEEIGFDIACRWGHSQCAPVVAAAIQEERAALAQFYAGPVAWREALEQQLFDLVELARDTRSDKGGEAKWTHPVSALIREFTKRITAPPRPDAPGHTDLMVRPETLDAFMEANPLPPDASAGLIEAAEILETDSHYSGSNAARWLQEAAHILRARAADRSGK
jgi:hypothetical protein